MRWLIALSLSALALGVVAACSSDEDSGSSSTGGTSSGGANTGGGPTGGASSGGANTGGANSGGTSSGGANTGGSTSGGGSGGGTSSYDCKNPDPAWLLCEDFEGMSAGFAPWLAASKWTENIGGQNPGRMTSSTEAHAGGYSLHMPAAASAGYQGADLMFRTCTGQNKSGCALTGYDQLFFRAYFKLAADHQRVHHFLSIGGSKDYWDAYGNAGCRPSGARHMGTTVDFKPTSHETFFYTYFPSMKCDPSATCSNYANPQAICDGCATKGMPCTNGLECCWGNNFAPTPAIALPLDKWVCFEMSMKANTPGQADGEMAYFIDGKLAHSKNDVSWRTSADLKLNMVRLQHYNETSDVKSHSNRIWFDDVVVSTKPVGCMP